MIRTAHPEFQDTQHSYGEKPLVMPTSPYSTTFSPINESISGLPMPWSSPSQQTILQSPSPRPHVQRAATNPSVTLPRLSALGSFLPHAPALQPESPSNSYPYSQKKSTYRSLSPEDRRALDTFRVVL